MSIIRELHVRAAPEAVLAALSARLGRSDDGSSQGLIINFDWGPQGPMRTKLSPSSASWRGKTDLDYSAEQ